jgi:hypothetical protein
MKRVEVGRAVLVVAAVFSGMLLDRVVRPPLEVAVSAQQRPTQ